jgi:hypothetical protein
MVSGWWHMQRVIKKVIFIAIIIIITITATTTVTATTTTTPRRISEI